MSKALNIQSRRFQKHPFHIVDPSPWPFFGAMAAFFFTFGLVMYMHFYKNGFLLFFLGFVLLIGVMFTWWRDVIREATFEGHHNSYVRKGLKMGMILFIVSEIMFFFCFFLSFFPF